MSEENVLKQLFNVPSIITLAGQEFKVSSPTLKDLAEAQQHVKELKKAKRKEALKERLDLLAYLPKDMNQAEKKEIVDSFLPQEITPQVKLDLFNSLPNTLSEEDKQRRMAFVLVEKDGTEWAEAIFILFKCLKKYQPTITLEQVEDMITIKDMKIVLEVISPKVEESSVTKNE